MFPDWRLWTWGGCQQPSLKWGIPCEWLRGHICPSLVSHKLEVGAKTWGSGSYWSSSGCFGLMATGVVVWILEGLLQIVSWFFGPVATDCGSEFYFHIWSCHCLFAYSVSQREERKREKGKNRERENGGGKEGKTRAGALRVENSWSLCFLNFETIGGRVRSLTAQVHWSTSRVEWFQKPWSQEKIKFSHWGSGSL